MWRRQLLPHRRVGAVAEQPVALAMAKVDKTEEDMTAAGARREGHVVAGVRLEGKLAVVAEQVPQAASRALEPMGVAMEMEESKVVAEKAAAMGEAAVAAV
eukprot:3142403-Prymnesium_polylepis.2